MNSAKAGKQVIEVMKLAYAANRPVLLEGKHGVGKSQLIEQAAKDLGIECIVRDLSLMEPLDLIGLPTQLKGRTVYAPPSFLPATGKGLLVFEELNRSDKYMMAPCLQLLTARRLNDYALPAGWLPVAAINPAADGYDVNELDPAMKSRFAVINVVADPKSWLAWARQGGVHPEVWGYVGRTAGIFNAEQSNPRAWNSVSDLVKAHDGGSPDALRMLIAGQVGEVHAAAFLMGLDGAEPEIEAEEIIESYSTVKRQVQAWVRARNLGQLQATSHGVELVLQDCDRCVEIAAEPAQKANLAAFAKDLGGDLGKKLRAKMKSAGVA